MRISSSCTLLLALLALLGSCRSHAVRYGLAPGGAATAQAPLRPQRAARMGVPGGPTYCLPAMGGEEVRFWQESNGVWRACILHTGEQMGVLGLPGHAVGELLRDIATEEDREMRRDCVWVVRSTANAPAQVQLRRPYAREAPKRDKELAADLAKALKNNRAHYLVQGGHLRFTFYSRNDYLADIDEMKVLGASLAGNTTVRHLDMADTLVDDSGITYLLGRPSADPDYEDMNEGLYSNTSLVSLDLSHNKVGEYGVKQLAQFLKKNRSLRVLRLYDNSVSYGMYDSNGLFSGALDMLSEALAVNNTLTRLDLGKNLVGTRYSEQLERSVANEQGMEALGKALSRNSGLVWLSLYSNELGSACGKGLARGLARNTALSYLNLGSNLLADEGIQALSGALAQCACLATLDLRHNGVGDAGVEALAGQLGRYGALRRLDLRGNCIGDRGARALLQGLAKNRTLREVLLAGNKISPALQRQIERCLWHRSVPRAVAVLPSVGHNGHASGIFSTLSSAVVSLGNMCMDATQSVQKTLRGLPQAAPSTYLKRRVAALWEAIGEVIFEGVSLDAARKAAVTHHLKATLLDRAAKDGAFERVLLTKDLRQRDHMWDLLHEAVKKIVAVLEKTPETPLQPLVEGHVRSVAVQMLGPT